VLKHWQLDARQFSSLFSIPKEKIESVISGETILDHHTLSRITKVLNTALMMTKDGVSGELLKYQATHDVTISDISKEIDIDADTIRRWVRGESSPNRNSLVRVASLIVTFDPKEEWLHHFSQFMDNCRGLGVKLKMVGEVFGVTTSSVNSWTTGRAPNEGRIRESLPMIKQANKLMDDLRGLFDDARKSRKQDQLEDEMARVGVAIRYRRPIG